MPSYSLSHKPTSPAFSCAPAKYAAIYRPSGRGNRQLAWQLGKYRSGSNISIFISFPYRAHARAVHHVKAVLGGYSAPPKVYRRMPVHDASRWADLADMCACVQPVARSTERMFAGVLCRRRAISLCVRRRIPPCRRSRQAQRGGRHLTAGQHAVHAHCISASSAPRASRAPRLSRDGTPPVHPCRGLSRSVGIALDVGRCPRT